MVHTLARFAVRGHTSFSCCVAETLSVALLPSVSAWKPAPTRIIFRPEELAERIEAISIKMCHTAVAPVAIPEERNKPTAKRHVRYESTVGASSDSHEYCILTSCCHNSCSMSSNHHPIDSTDSSDSTDSTEACSNHHPT